LSRASAFVVRKAGYASTHVLIEDPINVEVIFEKQDIRPQPPACSPQAECSSLGSLCFELPEGIEKSENIQDSDYTAVWYLQSGSEPRSPGILHGTGPNWSFGLPSDCDVWRSVQYAETVYSAPGPPDPEGILFIRDARGVAHDGKEWRYVGTFGESASYSRADSETARLPDRVLDSVCLISR